MTFGNFYDTLATAALASPHASGNAHKALSAGTQASSADVRSEGREKVYLWIKKTIW